MRYKIHVTSAWVSLLAVYEMYIVIQFRHLWAGRLQLGIRSLVLGQNSLWELLCVKPSLFFLDPYNLSSTCFCWWWIIKYFRGGDCGNLKKKALKKEDSSIQQLSNSYCLPGSWLTIKIHFHHSYERVMQTVLICYYRLCYFLFSIVYKFVDPQNVGWEKGMNCFFMRSSLTTCIHTFRDTYLKMQFSRPYLDLQNQKFWEVASAFLAGISEELWNTNIPEH